MKTAELLRLGFKKKTLGDDYWYELRYRGHRFITNDTNYNDGKDKWHIGYSDNWNNDFWFNDKLKKEEDFLVVYKVLTGSTFVYKNPPTP